MRRWLAGLGIPTARGAFASATSMFSIELGEMDELENSETDQLIAFLVWKRNKED